MMIKVRNLTKDYTTFKQKPGFIGAIRSFVRRKAYPVPALRSLSFDINSGELVGLIGPNGAGKSTMVKILSGILYPTSGEVDVSGYTPWKQRVSYVKHLGVVFGQKSQLWFDLPPLDTYALNKELYGIPSDRYEKNLHYLIRLLDIKEVVQRPTRQLSLGERMKCELVAAFLHEPEVVFLDEPTIGLDVIAKQNIRDFIKKINQEKKTTIILTTHDLGDIEELCKRVLLLHKGRLLFDGELERLKTRFGHIKSIRLVFKNRVNKIAIKGLRIARPSPLEAHFSVNTTKHNPSALLKLLLRKYKVSDVSIADPEIEDVIKRIYQEPG